MPGIEPKYERIIAYLKGLLSNRERHDLEKEMMQDAFEEEAFDGLTRISAEELAADMKHLGTRLKDRAEPERKRGLGLFYRMAAGIILLAGIAGILYLVFRMPSRSLLTVGTGKVTSKTPPAVQTPLNSDTLFAAKARAPENHAAEKNLPVITGHSERQDAETDEARRTETVSKAMDAEAVAEVAEVAEGNDIAENAKEKEALKEPVSQKEREPAVSKRKSDAAGPASAERAGTVLSTAKVVDQYGNPLPGVSIIEKGSVHGAVTDMDGKFSLLAFDAGAILTLKSIGYVPVEMNAKDMAGKEIPMTEDLVALDEVVVVGYGAQKKSEATGAVSQLSAEDISPGANTEVASFVNPVPPGGSIKAFKQWVVERLDESIMRAFPEKNKILVTLTVETDGSVRDIRMKETVPEPLVEEFSRIISQSPQWMPAMKDSVPVSAKIAIRFVTGTE